MMATWPAELSDLASMAGIIENDDANRRQRG
jgi:hypothetical protein